MRELPVDIKTARSVGFDVAFLAIDERGSASTVRSIVRRYQPSFQIARDGLDANTSNTGSIDNRRRALFYGPSGPFGAFAESIGMTIVPWHLLVDPEGIVRAAWAASDFGSNEVETELRAFRITEDRKH